MKETFDYFGTPILISDKVAYPSSGCIETAQVIDISDDLDYVRTKSPSGTLRWKRSKTVINHSKTIYALAKIYPEYHV